MRRSYGLFLGVGMLLALMPAAEGTWSGNRPPTDDKAKEEKVAKQKKAAQETWKELLPGGSPNLVESEHFLLVGSLEEKALEKVGKALEKHWPFVMKSLRFEEDDDKHLLWEGKLVLHFCKERTEFRTLYTKMKRDRPLDDELATYHHEGVHSEILIGPPTMGKSQVPLDVEAVGQLGAATLTRKRTARLPIWFVTGYARSHAYRYNPKLFGKERQTAALLLTRGKKTVGDLYTENDLPPAAVAVLRGSFVDFLAHSPQMAKYWPKILTKIDDQTPLETIWEETRLKGEDVQQAWVLWAQAPR
jgi:hypothetical protein